MRTQESGKHLNPEIELLLCCARRTVDGPRAARLKELLQGSIDWEYLLLLATQNGLLPLLYEHLRDSHAVPVQFHDANRQNSLRALFLTAELLRILEAFYEKKLPILPYKGPVLAQMAYANPLLRQFDDLDFVVPQRFISDVYEGMAVLGYEPKFQRLSGLKEVNAHIPGEYVFVHKVNRAMVEIHTEATLRHFPRRPNIEDMSRRSMDITLNGRQITTFGWADTLLLLCVHAAKDFWSQLLWVADVAEVINRLDAADWQRTSAEVKKYDAGRMVRLGLWLARAVFGSDFPASVAQEIKGDHVAARIGKVLCEQLLHQKRHPTGVVWRSCYRIGTVQPVWKGTFYWLRLSTAPTEEDWTPVSDGGGRAANHVFLRPLRLWRKYRRSVESGK